MPDDQIDANLYEILNSHGIEAAIQFAEQRAKNSITAKGETVTPELVEHISKAAFAEVKDLTAKIRRASLSPALNSLLEADSKKDAVRIIEKDLILDQEEFVKLIMNAPLYGFNHRRKHREFVPEHLKGFVPSALNDAKVGPHTKETKKAFNQIIQIFQQRRMLSVHWFQFGFEWHCFYFDQKDVMGEHWIGGDHVHYLSHLWNIPSEKVWDGFELWSWPDLVDGLFKPRLMPWI